MATKKKVLKSHTPARKKSAASSATSTRSRKAASKAGKSTAKSKAARKKEKELEDHKKLMELTLKAFQMTYDDYQQGKFHRIF
jgi:hypothetical protein